MHVKIAEPFFDRAILQRALQEINNGSGAKQSEIIARHGDVWQWDVSSISDMRALFNLIGLETFNQPIGRWNVAAVTDMSHMFRGARFFNQPIDQWNAAAVTDMTSMFGGAHAFNPVSYTHLTLPTICSV